MRIGIVVNVMGSQQSGQTTYRLAAACASAGDDVWILSPGNFASDPDNHIRALARSVPTGRYSNGDSYLKALNGPARTEEWITVDDLDILLLRNNPSAQNAWARHAGMQFGREAIRAGVIVLNDPNGLERALNKLYLQSFPESIRPETLITRNAARIRRFARDRGTVVVKPLMGSGGDGVLMLQVNDESNINQIIESVTRDGYVVAQEYLPAAAKGDTRLFLMNGIPLQHKGHYAAFRRIRTGDDLRSNLHAGGRIRKAELDDNAFRIAEIVRPRLVEDGMFLVGLDIVGDKLMEINVFSPGGLGSAQNFEKVDFTKAVVDALHRKVSYMKYYRRNFNNVELATL
ncbi:MAG: glutathione synthetase [Planctomycetota bacterium]|nr:glutathione synthetase [Planctomycetota bacterium]MDA1252006.1 glutathione synthetase [Planctomycetota bacterium]